MNIPDKGELGKEDNKKFRNKMKEVDLFSLEHTQCCCRGGEKACQEKQCGKEPVAPRRG